MMADPTSPTSPATDVRERSRDLILKTLGTSDSTEVDLKDLAHRIEEEIFKANNNSTDNTYRNSIRTHVLNLKENAKTGLRQILLEGDLSPETFAKMSGKDMMSSERQAKDKELLKNELEQTIAKPILPETIQQMKDGRTRSKWGVEGSFAAVD